MKNSLFVIALLTMGFTGPAQKKVFICTDIKSQIYHYKELCKELEKCKYEVKEVKENEAKDQEKSPLLNTSIKSWIYMEK